MGPQFPLLKCTDNRTPILGLSRGLECVEGPLLEWHGGMGWGVELLLLRVIIVIIGTVNVY